MKGGARQAWAGVAQMRSGAARMRVVTWSAGCSRRRCVQRVRPRVASCTPCAPLPGWRHSCRSRGTYVHGQKQGDMRACTYACIGRSRETCARARMHAWAEAGGHAHVHVCMHGQKQEDMHMCTQAYMQHQHII